MAYINENFLNLQDSYLFSKINEKVNEFQQENPKQKIIKLGIGDVTRPIAKSVSKAMHEAVDEMENEKTFKGYGPEVGYDFLKETIIKNDYNKRNITFENSEIFISNGISDDIANILDIFSTNKILITDPVYPAYLDTNVMAGNSGKYNENNGKYSNIIYASATAENDFIIELPKEKVDIIYLCFPNNPTGTVLSKEELQKWVNYAKENDSIILYDAAYEAYITEKNIPHSIYEIEGANEVAIEFKSFSKTAGFTGVRCGYTVVPKQVYGYTKDDKKISLNKLWTRRVCTKSNGVSYIIQKGAQAIYSEEGQKEINESVQYYMNNAQAIRKCFEYLDFEVYGGINAPYVWIRVPNNMKSWEFFDMLINKIAVVGTPGVGFGPSGEGYFRFTGFATKEDTDIAIDRIKECFK